MASAGEVGAALFDTMPITNAPHCLTRGTINCPIASAKPYNNRMWYGPAEYVV